uniref:Uncharacterized protein n=1 Tax=Zea mays TaxID=4577 RepID=A0A804RLZ7_MAIZE
MGNPGTSANPAVRHRISLFASHLLAPPTPLSDLASRSLAAAFARRWPPTSPPPQRLYPTIRGRDNLASHTRQCPALRLGSGHAGEEAIPYPPDMVAGEPALNLRLQNWAQSRVVSSRRTEEDRR